MMSRVSSEIRLFFPVTAIFLALNFFYTPFLEKDRNHILDQIQSPDSIRKNLFPLPEEFKGLIADWAYAQADQYFHGGAWYKILPLLRLTAIIRPERTSCWSTGSWHLAFNRSEESGNNEEKKFYIQMGFNFINEGIRRHPDVAHLYFDRGWTSYMRLKAWDDAIDDFKMALSVDYEWKYVTWLAYMYHQTKRFAEEKIVWQDYLSRFPNDEKVEKVKAHYAEAVRLEIEQSGGK